MQNSIGHIKYVLLIGRDVTRGKHHVMKSSRPSPSFLCVGSKIAIQLIAGRKKAWSRGYKESQKAKKRALESDGEVEIHREQDRIRMAKRRALETLA